MLSSFCGEDRSRYSQNVGKLIVETEQNLIQERNHVQDSL